MVIDISRRTLKGLFRSTKISSPKTISRTLESSSQVRLRLSKVTVMVAANDARPRVPMDKSHRFLSLTVIIRRLSTPKLSKDEMEALYQLRRGRKRQRGNDRNARTAVLEADAGSTSSDVDDDRTVAFSNGRTSNRTNSALVRQRRPK
jgi:hypothetical protein